MISTPAQQQPDHIAEVMNGVADQGQGTETEANGQLHAREHRIEHHAPTEGRAGTGGVMVVMPVMVLVPLMLVLVGHQG